VGQVRGMPSKTLLQEGPSFREIARKQIAFKQTAQRQDTNRLPAVPADASEETTDVWAKKHPHRLCLLLEVAVEPDAISRQSAGYPSCCSALMVICPSGPGFYP